MKEELFALDSLRKLTPPPGIGLAGTAGAAFLTNAARRPRQLDKGAVGEGASGKAGGATSGMETRVKLWMSKVYSSEVLKAQEMFELKALLKREPRVRATVAAILSQPKVQGVSSLCLTLNSYNCLATIMLTLLDGCLLATDYSSATGVLDCCRVFFSEDAAGHRKYIEEEIQGHQLWKQIEYWNAALAEHIRKHRENVAAAAAAAAAATTAPPTPSAAASAASPGNAKAASASVSAPAMTAAEREKKEHELILQWMIGSAHQMLSCGVDGKSVSRCMDDLMERYGIDSGGQATIRQFLDKITAAMEQWNS
jgi:hypothetical protein